jgi:PKD domain
VQEAKDRTRQKATFRMNRTLLAALLTPAALLAIPATALADPPNASFGYFPHDPLPGEPVTFSHPATVETEGWSWDFGDGSSGSEATVTHSFAAPGVYVVQLTVVNDDDDETDTKSVAVRVNEAPIADFLFFPAKPEVGDPVDFVSTSFDPERVTSSWDFNGDGSVDATGQHVFTTFSDAGTRQVTLTARDPHGEAGVARQDVTVARAPDNTTLPKIEGLRLLSPFPVVRLAGQLTSGGVRVQLLTVRAPSGAKISIRCRGRGCPVPRISKRSKGGRTRFKRLERRLSVGTVIEVLVSRSGRIGKFTRFRIVSGAAPRRMDRCLMPGASKGIRCPSD